MPALPAATATMTLAFHASWMAPGIAEITPVRGTSGPIDRLITFAPALIAYSMPVATSLSEPPPALFSTLTARMRAPGATAAMPLPLLVSAATMPLVMVPCPLSSWTAACPVPVRLPSPLVKRAPATTLPARSGCEKSTPVSTSATSTPAPVAEHHAGGARMLAGAPLSAHWSPLLNSGSFGDDVAAAAAGWASRQSAAIATTAPDAEHYLVIVNAATREKDVAWMREHGGDDVGLHDASDELALIAVQGPRSIDILEPITTLDGGGGLRDMRPFGTSGARIAGVDEAHAQRISRTGYSGEDGFEVVVASGGAGQVWDVPPEAGAPRGPVPAGLGPRDTLRLEAGLRLYGQDMDDSTDPYSAALGWTVKLDKGDFVGAAALRRLRETPPRRFVGLRLGPRTIARHGQAVRQGGREVGVVTSGSFGFTVGTAVATASVTPDFDRDGDVAVDIRGTAAPADVVRLPFYRRPKGEGNA